MRQLGTADLDLLEAMMEPLIDAPFFVKDAGLRYVAANSSMARLCGRDHPRELYGRSAADFFPATQASHFETLDRGVLATGAGFRDHLIRSEQSRKVPIWLLFARTPVRDAAGTAVGVIATARELRETAASGGALRRLATVVEHIRAHFAEPLDSRGLAALVGISESQLHRDFERHIGTSPRDIQAHVRLEQALRLLTGSNSISAIAHACGYADQSAFTRRLRQQTGRTPGELREALKEQRSVVGPG